MIDESDAQKLGEDQSAQETANVSVVYARLPLPVLSSSNIESWFVTMDFWFTASGISADRQKTATVLAALDPSVISQLTDVIAAMPQVERYEYIRSKIIEHFADSEQRRLNRLLSELPLGDRKPSELYHEMKRVAGTTLGEAALKSLWIKRLPDVVQPVVAASTGPASEFTKIADSIVDAVSTSHIRAVSSSSHDPMEEIRAEIASLNKRFEKLTTRSRSRNRAAQSRTRYKSSGNESRQIRNSPTDAECWYHQRHGRSARRCRSPCRHKDRKVNAVSNGAEGSTA
ncbi:uncharacterized protein LOC142235374 [Haematobia irritans]|uniref:uncharacterized protein LOC142235374 n=1 Tax=Haematobia irritans TaxID=7368 RepID=UPI003F4F4523